MKQLKQIWKYQISLSLVLIGLNICSIYVNPIRIKADLSTFIHSSYPMISRSLNSKKGVSDALLFLLNILRLKDITMLIIISVCIIFIIGLYTMILKKKFGSVALFFIAVTSVVLCSLNAVNVYLMYQLGVRDIVVMVESISMLAVAIGMISLHIYFMKTYIAFRKTEQMPFVTRQSILVLAFKIIRTMTYISIACLSVFVFGLLFISKAGTAAVQYFSFTRYFDQPVYAFNMVDLFNALPERLSFIWNALESHFGQIQNHTVSFDVYALDQRIQSQLLSYIQQYKTMWITQSVKMILIYGIILLLNRWYQRKQFKQYRVLSVLCLFVGAQIVLTSSTFFIFQIYDIMVIIAIFMYVFMFVDDTYYNGELVDKSKQAITQMYGRLKTSIKKRVAIFQIKHKD